MPNLHREPHAAAPQKQVSGRWQGRVTFYDPDTGKRRETTQNFATEPETQKWSREQETLYRENPNQRPPTTEWLTDYLNRWLQETVVGYQPDSTAQRYRLSLAHVQRLIGTLPLTKVTARDIQGVYNALLSEGKANSTVKHVHVGFAAEESEAGHQASPASAP